MTNVAVTVDGRAGWSSIDDGGRTVWFTGHLLDPPSRGEAACRHVAEATRTASDAASIGRAVHDLDGHFAFIVEGPDRTVAAVDRVRSTPIFFGESDTTLHIDPWALRLRDRLGLGVEDVDGVAALLLAMSGYTLGRTTLYGAIRQLQPGELLVATQDGSIADVHRYYVYLPTEAGNDEREDRQKELGEVTLAIFEKLAAAARGRTILVPLSGGLDSRLVVAGLKEIGFNDVRCFAYGTPGNFEAETSHEVSRKLGVPWSFIPVTHRMMREVFTAEEHKRYLRWTDSCASVPVEHEFVAVAELRRRGWTGRDAIIVNGQSGDYLTGGHVPATLVEEQHLWRTESERKRVITDALIRKHYSLWEALKTPSNLDRLRDLLWADISANADLPTDAARDYGLYEMSEWQNRQCRYIVTNQRVYEYFGFDWALPLWAPDYLDFWETAPLAAKREQSLYRHMLNTYDWGGVWRSVPDRDYVSPRWLRATRPMMKAAVGAVSGRSGWKAFEHRFLDYWMDIQGKIAVVPYSTVVRDGRGWRHAVSWLTEAYLARHGLDWRGQPMTEVDR